MVHPSSPSSTRLRAVVAVVPSPVSFISISIIMLSYLSHCRSSRSVHTLAPAAVAAVNGSRPSPTVNMRPSARLIPIKGRFGCGRQYQNIRVSSGNQCRLFHGSSPRSAIKPQILRDVGEGKSRYTKPLSYPPSCTLDIEPDNSLVHP